MIHYTLIDDQGVILQRMSGPAGLILPPTPSPGQTVLDAEAQVGTDWWTGTEFAARPPQPTPHHIWQSGAWVDPRTADEVLNAAKAARWETIKAARETHEFGGFVWDGSTFDSDAISQSRIQGAMQLAQLAGSDFSINWTLRDNTARALNAVDLTAVGIAMGQHVTASHARARELRAAIESVGNLDDLNKIKW